MFEAGRRAGPPVAADPSPELDWNLLRAFVAIVEEGGITRAANRLGLRQPTVSNALKRLEQQLGRRFVERGRGAFRVTEAGELLYREAVEIGGSFSRLATVLRDVGEEVTGHIGIALASHVVCPFFDEILAEFHRAHPRVTYRLNVETSAAVMQSVLQKSASCGVCLVHRKHPRLDYVRMYREHFGFFCGPPHRLFGRNGLTLKDLKKERFVSFETDRLSDALRPVALLREREGIEGHVVGTSSNLEEVRRLVVAGIGVGPLPVHVVQRDVRDGLLWRLPPYRHPPAIDIYLVTNPRTRLDRAERRFVDVLRKKIVSTPERERTMAR